jgi:hypothetical protein
MNSRLEQFIHDHREEFDADEPGKKVWEKIQHQAGHAGQPGRAGQPDRTSQPGSGETEIAPVMWISAGRWSVAAAVSLLIAGSVWYFSRNSGAQDQPGLASRTQAVKPAKSVLPAQGDAGKTGTTKKAVDTQAIVAAPKDHPLTTRFVNNDNIVRREPSPEDDYKEEMHYYGKLVDIKHRELKSIEKDEPLLYKQFAGDVFKLDSVYRNLEKQLPKNSNREQLLEAMLQNLQLQMGLLNHQLDIIKQINHSKKTAYEKAYKIA